MCYCFSNQVDYCFEHDVFRVLGVSKVQLIIYEKSECMSFDRRIRKHSIENAYERKSSQTSRDSRATSNNIVLVECSCNPLDRHVGFFLVCRFHKVPSQWKYLHFVITNINIDKMAFLSITMSQLKYTSVCRCLEIVGNYDTMHWFSVRTTKFFIHCSNGYKILFGID